jgi:Na+/phosphate symporter
MEWLWLAAGVVIGANIGGVLIAMLASSSRADDCMACQWQSWVVTHRLKET